MMAIAIIFVSATTANAEMQPPETAPPELVELLGQIDAAASDRDIDQVMQYFSEDFTHSDGLSYETLQVTLEAFWDRYTTLSYETQLTGWDTSETGWLTETETTITGLEPVGSRMARLHSVLTSRQTFDDTQLGAQLIDQEVLSERSQLTLGMTPPSVEVNLPGQVAIGQQFSFDAIVLEPLGDRILLGSAFEEPIEPENYTASPVIDLDLLSAGGLFKIGRAPTTLGDRWISAVIVREDGITSITRRLQVVSPDDLPSELRTE